MSLFKKGENFQPVLLSGQHGAWRRLCLCKVQMPRSLWTDLPAGYVTFTTVSRTCVKKTSFAWTRTSWKNDCDRGDLTKHSFQIWSINEIRPHEHSQCYMHSWISSNCSNICKNSSLLHSESSSKLPFAKLMEHQVCFLITTSLSQQVKGAQSSALPSTSKQVQEWPMVHAQAWVSEWGDRTVKVRCTNMWRMFAKAKEVLGAGTECALLLGRPGAVLRMLISGLSNSNNNNQ